MSSVAMHKNCGTFRPRNDFSVPQSREVQPANESASRAAFKYFLYEVAIFSVGALSAIALFS